MPDRKEQIKRIEKEVKRLDRFMSNNQPKAGKSQKEIRSDLGAICLRCMQKDPADRYPSGGPLAADFARALACATDVREPVTMQ